MNELQIFQNSEFGQVRTIEIDGEPWLVGKDVAVALGYADTNKAIAMHVDDEDKLNDKTALSLGQRGGWLINESGLYALVLSSKLPGAKRFRRWVTSDGAAQYPQDRGLCAPAGLPVRAAGSGRRRRAPGGVRGGERFAEAGDCRF